MFGSYGQGRARISSGTDFGFYAHNNAGIEIHNLDFAGAGRLTNTNSGVLFYLDSTNVRLYHILLDSVSVQGYRGTGISIGSWNGTSGYDNVRVTNCRMSANGEAGLASYAQALAAHHNWYVGYCQAFDNSGRTDVTNTHTGNGIVLSGIDGATIEYCEAFNNGWLNANQSGGPVGIWGWCCNNLRIQYCESHHNRSGTAHDGGGFDLDGGCTNSVLQYNYSHDNEGPGYLLAQYPGAPPLTDVTIRYNISENDGRRHGQGAIMLWSSGSNGGIQRASIHNNTIYLTPPADGSRPKAVDVTSGGISNITLRNNLLQTTGGLPLVFSATTQGVLFQGNAYWSTGQPLAIQWGSSTYSTLPDWRTGAAQEVVGTRQTGLFADPQMRNPGTVGTVAAAGSGRSLTSLHAYHLLSTSPLLGAGLSLLTEFGVGQGPRDFFGTATPAGGARGNIGAYESLPVVMKNATGAVGSPWCESYPNPARETLHLSIASISREAIIVRMYDNMGRVRFTQSSGATSGLLALQVPVAALGAGHYQLEVVQGGKRHHQAIVVE